MSVSCKIELKRSSVVKDIKLKNEFVFSYCLVYWKWRKNNKHISHILYITCLYIYITSTCSHITILSTFLWKCQISIFHVFMSKLMTSWWPGSYICKIQEVCQSNCRYVLVKVMQYHSIRSNRIDILKKRQFFTMRGYNKEQFWVNCGKWSAQNSKILKFKSWLIMCWKVFSHNLNPLAVRKFTAAVQEMDFSI